jgi:large subunit ribosomal protein L35
VHPDRGVPAETDTDGSTTVPKQKTHSGAKKRFKVTGGGKVKARHAFTSHILEKKSPKRKRHLGNAVILSDHDAKRVKQLLGAKTK